MTQKKPPKVDKVKVHHTAGCSMCGRKDAHKHTWPDWDRHVHGVKR